VYRNPSFSASFVLYFTIMRKHQDNTLESIPNVEGAFWRRAKLNPKTGCWLWQGPLANGYGIYYRRNQYVKAHRLAYEISTGNAPEGRIYHKCPYKACINPAHLQLQGFNFVGLKGVGNGNHKLNWALVTAIRREYLEKGVTLAILAARYNVSKTTIHRVIHRMTWTQET
jgi:hypothetical protein